MNKEKRSNWTNSEISQMLEIIKEKKILNLCDGKKYRSLEIYKSVANELSENNIIRTPEQIRTKLKTLRKLFCDVKKNNAKSGSAREECEHYCILEEIFGDRPAITCLNSGVDSGRNENKGDENICSVEEDFNCPSTSSFSSSSSNHPRRQKRKLTKDEKLLGMHHKWLEEEFKKQRKFEKELIEDFKKTITGTMRDLTQQLQSGSTQGNISTPEPETENSQTSSSSISDFFGSFNPNT